MVFECGELIGISVSTGTFFTALVASAEQYLIHAHVL
jgi:hypothetical protein